jgi:hypothetical protein
VPDLKFDLRLITPAFAGEVPSGTKSVTFMGRPQGSPPEAPKVSQTVPDVPYFPVDPLGLRIPSLRGLLGFWQRSLYGHLASEQVFQRQAALLGSAGGGQGLSLRHGGQPTFTSGPLTYDQQPYAFVYLGYGPLQVLNVAKPKTRRGDADIAASHNRSQCRDAILVEDDPALARFSFVARGGADQLAELRQALTLLHLFGGIGSRSRRGWGSVEVCGDFLPPLAQQGAVAPWLANALKQVRSDLPPLHGVAPADFSAFSSATQIFVTPEKTTYQDVLLDFFDRFQQIRAWRQRPPAPIAVTDHHLEAADAANPAGLTGVPERLAFGMPYHPRSRKNWEIDYHGRKPGTPPDKALVSRRASPILLKVLRSGPRRYAGVILFLKASFFGDPALEVGAKGKPQTQPFPGWGAVDAFLKTPGLTPVGLP